MQAERLTRGIPQRWRPIPNAFGFTKAHLDFNQDESAISWQVGTNPILFPYQLAFGPQQTVRRVYALGVPVDDTRTWHITYDCFTFPPEVEMPKQNAVPYVDVPLQDENGAYTLDYSLSQDMVAWYSQGDITDRTQETLGASDVCVVAYRELLSEQIDRVARGEKPINLFFDQEAAYAPDLRIPGFEPEKVGAQSPDSVGAASYYRDNYHKISKGGWLYIEDDIERYSPDREVILEAYRQLEMLRSRAPAVSS